MPSHGMMPRTLRHRAAMASDIGADAHAGEIVCAVLHTSHAMGFRMNAEGVEHDHQVAMLHDEGCEAARGFLFGQA